MDLLRDMARKRIVQVPEEGPVADELGLTGATPDGVVAMLQLPPLLPSVSLFEAAERAALEAPTSDNQQLPEGTKPKPKFQRGPEVLKALPDGRVRPSEAAGVSSAWRPRGQGSCEHSSDHEDAIRCTSHR